MNYKEFIQKYEELLNSGYCECNELNCLDNNPPKKILNIMKEQQQEIERLNNIINELEKVLDENVELTYVHYGRRQYNKTLTEGGLLFRDYIKSKLQELKGSDKE